MITVKDAAATCEAFGFGTKDYLRTWFAGAGGSILFVRRVSKPGGGVWFRATKGFAAHEVDEAARYIADFDDGDALFIKTSTFNKDKIDRRAETEGFVVGNKDEVDTVVGVAMDVDAGKRDSYASQAIVWQAIHEMPTPPTMIALSGHADHGFHVYWRFADPILAKSAVDVENLNQRIQSWRDLLRDKIAALLDPESIEGFDPEKLVDRTYGVDRVLRPIGAVRTSGDAVRLVWLKPDNLYALEDLTAPGWAPAVPAGPAWPRPEESVIDRFFAAKEREGKTVTLEALLRANHYSPIGDGDWIRDGAETGSRSLAEGDVINGLEGVNVFSGGCAPLKCGDDKNDTGRRYSLQQLWVAFYFGDTDDPESWAKAAAYCHERVKPLATEVFDEIEPEDPDQEYPRIMNAEKIGNELLPLSMKEIVGQLRDAYPGWPKACRGQLFVVGRGDEVRLLDKPTKFFGWANHNAQTIFHTGPSAITKAEFFDQVPEYMEQYQSIEKVPHFPPIKDFYYLHASPKPTDGKTLTRFLDFFAPSTPADRELILAFIVTTFWGGAAGARPMFGIDATRGTGTGKSALAFKVAALSGSCFQFDQKTNEDRLRSNLISDVSGDKRMAVLDNMKTARISNAVLESLITAPEIAGHAMYRGFASRPNHLTWVVTMNGMAMSRDLAQRTVKIVVTEPTSRKLWNEAIDRFIDSNRKCLVADIAGFFERDRAELTTYSRWSSWEDAVISRCADPDGLCALIRSRASEADADSSTSASLVEYLRERLTELEYSESDIVHIPTSICAEWAGNACGREMNRSQLTGMLSMLVGSGSLQGMAPNPSRKNGRGWLFIGAQSTSDSQVLYDLEDRIGRRGIAGFGIE